MDSWIIIHLPVEMLKGMTLQVAGQHAMAGPGLDVSATYDGV